MFFLQHEIAQLQGRKVRVRRAHGVRVVRDLLVAQHVERELDEVDDARALLAVVDAYNNTP